MREMGMMALSLVGGWGNDLSDRICIVRKFSKLFTTFRSFS